ncbi:MAG: septation regulator SpoVG [Spirochaetota bacterium]
MELTDIRVRRITGDGRLRAYATITFDHCFVVHNVKIIEGHGGLFVAMPNRRTKNGEFRDVAHPITPEFRALIEEQVMTAYNNGDTEEYSES